MFVLGLPRLVRRGRCGYEPFTPLLRVGRIPLARIRRHDAVDKALDLEMHRVRCGPRSGRQESVARHGLKEQLVEAGISRLGLRGTPGGRSKEAAAAMSRISRSVRLADELEDTRISHVDLLEHEVGLVEQI